MVAARSEVLHPEAAWATALLRSLHRDLDEAERARWSFYLDFEQRRAEERLIDLRRQLVRLAPEVDADWHELGNAWWALRRTRPGWARLRPAGEALLRGASSQYGLTPIVLDPTYEAAIMWHDRELIASRESQKREEARLAAKEAALRT
ncbi:MAG: hypothetical protein U0360_01350 [Dehalococcoidia bacterium]